MWHALVPWVATHVFHITGAPATYFRDRQRRHDAAIYSQPAVRGGCRRARRPYGRSSIADARTTGRSARGYGCWSAITWRSRLFGYGFVKIVPLQFQRTLLFKMMEPYGDFSPMGVLWSFMGASLPYVIYSGCAEVLGGILLLFRRTTTLGALVSFAVMLNVAVLNYCYDVPVKLYSTNLF